MAVPVSHKGFGVGNSQSHKLVGDWELNGVGLINKKGAAKIWREEEARRPRGGEVVQNILQNRL